MVLKELATYLQGQGLGTMGTNLFYGFMPPDPDICLVLYEYGGLPLEPDMGTPNPRIEYPLIQVVVRGSADEDQDAPRLKIQQAVTALTKIGDQSLSGVQYLAVMAKQAPFFLKRDENFRFYFACNFQVMKDYSYS